MKRRNFLKQSSLFSLGGLLIPSTLAASCRKERLSEDQNWDGKVIIIGAGAAGLYAGYLLQSKHIHFEILEASTQYGGRLGKLSGFAQFPLDLGAQWMHGKNHLVGTLLSNTQTKVTLDDSEIHYWFRNQLTDRLPKSTDIFEGRNLPDISYLSYASQKGLGADYRYIIEAIAGDQGADSTRLSVFYNALESQGWNSGEDDYKFEETYFDFIDQHIARPIQDSIHLNTVIRTIDYTGPGVKLTDTQGRTYTADKILLTVPITILQSGDLEFIPALPAEKTEAFSKIGMDAGMKVFLRFSRKFFKDYFIGGKNCAAYLNEGIGKPPTDIVLLAFVMGTQAEALSKIGSDAGITQILLTELDEMYQGQASETFLDAYVQNWFTQPYIRGAYSYSTVGMGNARSIAAQSIAQKIYFAGEAMNLNGHHQTVQGAMETGYREVVQLLKDIKH
jgi:monoamine oxidase